jgi:hypothetical protein
VLVRCLAQLTDYIVLVRCLAQLTDYIVLVRCLAQLTDYIALVRCLAQLTDYIVLVRCHAQLTDYIVLVQCVAQLTDYIVLVRCLAQLADYIVFNHILWFPEMYCKIQKRGHREFSNREVHQEVLRKICGNTLHLWREELKLAIESAETTVHVRQAYVRSLRKSACRAGRELNAPRTSLWKNIRKRFAVRL